MRLVERVRLNCVVKSRAQFSGNGSWYSCGCGTGFRRGTPLLPDIVATSLLSVDQRKDARKGARAVKRRTVGTVEVVRRLRLGDERWRSRAMHESLSCSAPLLHNSDLQRLQ